MCPTVPEAGGSRVAERQFCPQIRRQGVGRWNRPVSRREEVVAVKADDESTENTE